MQDVRKEPVALSTAEVFARKSIHQKIHGRYTEVIIRLPDETVRVFQNRVHPLNPLIALTGGIACGKTLAESCLKTAGIPFSIDMDEICHRLYRKLPEQAACKLRDVWGLEAVSEEGEVNRAYLSRAVFSGADTTGALALLHEVIHPEIDREAQRMIRAWCDSGHTGAILVVVPLLYEYDMQGNYDKVISVWCDHRTQLKRLMHRNGFTEEEAQRRIDSQMSADRKLERADFGLINTGTPEALRKQCEEVVRKIHEIYFQQ